MADSNSGSPEGGWKVAVEEGKPIGSYAFVFVCQEGPLEVEAILLAASLRRHVKCPHELIAAVPVPEGTMGVPSEATLNVLEALGVRIERVENTFINAERREKSYLLSNKIFALRVPCKSDKLIFLDTDTVMRSDFFGHAYFSNPVCAGLVGWGGARPSTGCWRGIYEDAGVEMPAMRVAVYSGRKSGLEMALIPPYFNSGLVAIHSELAAEFSACWLEIYKRLQGSTHIRKAYFTEQIALPVALEKMRIPYCIMPEEERSALVFHYMLPEKVETSSWAKPYFQELATSLIEEHPEVSDLLRRDSEWAFLFESFEMESHSGQ